MLNRYRADNNGIAFSNFHKIEARRKTIGGNLVIIALYLVAVADFSLKIIDGQLGIV